MSGREFSGFDVDRISEAVRQPPLDELRSTARTRRRRSVAAVATAVVALAGVAAVPLVGAPDRTNPVVPSARPDHSGDFTMTGPGSGVDVRREGCVLRFAVTGDGGRSWSDRDAAQFRGTRCEASSTSTGGDLSYAVLSDRSYLVSDAGSVRLSTDFGRTWRDEAEAIVAVPSFPVTARAVFCGYGCPVVQEPLAVDPSTGTVYRLTGDAPSGRPLFGLYPSPDGTIWATYQATTNPQPTIARSVDRGATWTTSEVGADTTVLAMVGLDKREGYLLTESSTAGGSTRVLRTADGGQSWTDTGANLPAQPHWDLTAGSDGTLLAVTAGAGTGPNRLAQLLVSWDHGRTFLIVREYGPLVGSISVAPGYAWLFGRDDGAAGEPDHVLVTTDAATWTRLTLSP
ncbi:hypothetical protein [Micromonospora orduensis]|uniref:hypothetical protein n=1 Tax=Micromonospora orduensis TaxID=1420891 RepID=UPI0033FAAB5C